MSIPLWHLPHEARPYHVFDRWRYALGFELWSASLITQGRDKQDGGWRDCGTGYVRLWTDRCFRLGEYHGYYDGPHCLFSLGWLHLAWSWGACEKCMPSGR